MRKMYFDYMDISIHYHFFYFNWCWMEWLIHQKEYNIMEYRGFT